VSTPFEAPVIRRLAPDVVARIAAGEVIDRPAAVVKELLENSFDAGATRVSVDVDGGLDRLLRISDDGSGMDEAGARLALERHATSKIREAEDLLTIRSLGFRGEGLASVAAVSRLVLLTATAPGQGVRLVAEGGHIVEVSADGRARGTTIEVRDLFFNTPARRKFQRAASTELQQAARLLQSYALVRRDVHLTYTVDGREILNLPPAGSLEERVAAVYGRERAKRMIRVEGRNSLVAIDGFLGAPEDSRARSDQQTFFVNGRLVSNPILRQAVRQAFGNLIPFDRHPFALLAIDIDPTRVDVNVHPTKKEIRFSNDRDLFPALVSILKPAVVAHVPRFGGGAGGGAAPGDATDTTVADLAELFGAGGGAATDAAGAGVPADEEGVDAAPGSALTGAPGLPLVLPFHPIGGAFAREGQGAPALAAGVESPVVAELWQLHRTYILAAIRGGLLIIDQHAAHERVLFEEALLRLRSGRPVTQELLFPQVVDLTAEEFHVLLDVHPTLEKLGFHVELFGGTTVVVHGIPAGVTRWSEGQLLHDIIGMYGDLPGGPPLEERVSRSYACRAAVKSGEPLTAVEMNELIDRLFATTLPQGDPHGRPTFLRLSIDDIHRRFGRSG
jgi:DNA mismatch repair protein MutL